jgi:hypothetical protein
MTPTQQCRAFTQKHNGLSNRIITDVLISVAFDPKNQPPNVQFFKTRALWDTGATHSVITEATAKSLTLTATGKRLVQHAGGKGDFNTHVVNFYLPNQVAIAGVLVSECPDNDGSFGAIIGMDIIMGGDLSISNHQGQTWVTFRYPSLQGVDYVADFNRATKAVVGKVGRNDPCPCGSGKKYKKCHGAVG